MLSEPQRRDVELANRFMAESRMSPPAAWRAVKEIRAAEVKRMADSGVVTPSDTRTPPSVGVPPLSRRTDTVGVGPAPPAPGPIAPQPITYAYPDRPALPLANADQVRAAIALFAAFPATDKERGAAWARVQQAGQQYGVVVPASWSGVNFAERPAVVRDRSDIHTAALAILASEGGSTDPKAPDFSDRYRKALLRVGAGLAGQRQAVVEQAASLLAAEGRSPGKALRQAEEVADSVGIDRPGRLVRDNADLYEKAQQWLKARGHGHEPGMAGFSENYPTALLAVSKENAS